jgi:serine/threonine-protein kinase
MTGEHIGNWHLLKLLGRGGMGRVYLAEDKNHRRAAVKVLSNQLSSEPGFLDRFLREIEALQQFEHPHIVRFYDSGEEGGNFYYAMEFVDGKSLHEALQQRKRLPWLDAVYMAWQMCRALRHVHERGIVHRDLKPSNILMTAAGDAKLSDFGIAKIFEATQLTATGGVVGTAEYLSPEQASGKPVTKRSDLYSLGVVLYETLTGRTPFVSQNTLELLHKHRFGQFDPPRSYVPDLPADLDALVCQMLEKNAEDRPADASEVGKRLERIADRYAPARDPATTSLPKKATVKDHAEDHPTLHAAPGPGTLHRDWLRLQSDTPHAEPRRGRSPVNNVWTLSALLALCLGVLVYAFWPPSTEQLFAEGSRLMQSNQLSDLEDGWRNYLGPLQRRDPNYRKDEVERYHKRLLSARNRDKSEAYRLLKQGEGLMRLGRREEALAVYRNLVLIFGDNDAESFWVDQARLALEADPAPPNEDRLRELRPALERAANLAAAGKRVEAEKIWAALEAQYAGDPIEADVQRAVRQARGM